MRVEPGDELGLSVLGRVQYAQVDFAPSAEMIDNNTLNKKMTFVSNSALSGLWKGRIHTYNGDLPIEITLSDQDTPTVRIGDGHRAVLEDITFEDDLLTGVSVGDIETEDASKRPYTLAFDLSLRWNVLNGSVSAISKPAAKLGNALSHWCELEKAS